jgi:hypothetical protein
MSVELLFSSSKRVKGFWLNVICGIKSKSGMGKVVPVLN